MKAAALYGKQMERVYAAALAARRYPASLINGKHTLLKHDTAPPTHTAALSKAKIKQPPGRSSSRTFDSLEVVIENKYQEFFASKPAEWYRRRGIEQLAQRWTEVIKLMEYTLKNDVFINSHSEIYFFVKSDRERMGRPSMSIILDMPAN